jgi:hypothetical protein
VGAGLRIPRLLVALLAATCALAALCSFPAAAAAAPCDTPVTNEIACENTKPGNPHTEWDLPDNQSDPTIQGFTTDFSVNRGTTVRFKIKTDASAYRIDIYRMGYYGGDGARKVATRTPSVTLPQLQPECLKENSTGLVDCGNWAQSATWAVPSTAVSGIYFARLVRLDTLGASHVPFVVRDDEGGSDILFQTADTTWQAYNRYGGNSLYVGSHNAQGLPSGRAYKVSYNRPFTTRDYQGMDFLFFSEYPMVRWMEANGYDVSYFSGVDTARRGHELLEHQMFMTAGHDEYWSGGQRASVEAARAAGVDLAFFSGNDVYWKTRWEKGIDGANTDYRTLVCYKETAANAKLDPTAEWTGTWRDARHSPPSDGGRPENALLGTRFGAQFRGDPLHVPESDGKLRLWRNTSIANLAPGQTAALPEKTLGFEWNDVPDDDFRPPGLVRFSSTTIDVQSYLIDEGAAFGSARATHHLTLYKHASGALVFSAATIQWPWALDSGHEGSGPEPDVRVQQATVNLFADMGAQPSTLRPDLVPATASTDVTPAQSAVTSPSQGATVPRGVPVTISGTASDAGGGRVGGVEVSVDGGVTWRMAQQTRADGTVDIGRESWTFRWIPKGSGDVTIWTRAVDDSGNLEAGAPRTTVQVAGCPCSIWGDGYEPAMTSPEGAPIELGVKFRSDVDGYVTGIRFYKGPGNAGTHTGHLWTESGQLLASATFINESQSGWQQALLGAPVRIQANTTYVASYYAPQGHWSRTNDYFVFSDFASAPLRATRSDAFSQNGVYNANGRGFPAQSYQGTNYWVDVVFAENATDTVPPRIDAVEPTGGSQDVSVGSEVSATFTEELDATTVSGATFELRDASGAIVPASIRYDAATETATLDPSGRLALSSTYTARIEGGADGVKDPAGNPLEADATFSFTTATPQPCPCSLWTDATTPGTAAVPDSSPHEIGVKFRSDVDGYVTGVRFYKGPGNTGTHVGSLWSSSGTLLRRVTFRDETASGWQEAHFGSPLAVTAGTTYVVSYYAPNGAWARDFSYFETSSHDNGQLHALASGIEGGNGVYRSGEAGFPSQSYHDSNYWVDVVFSDDATDAVAPEVEKVKPSANATKVSTAADVTAEFSEHVDPATVTASTFTLRDAADAPVAATIGYDPQTLTATLRPSAPLALSTTYTATIEGGPDGVKDPAGNELANDRTWTFSTATPAVCPCSIWDDTATPATDSVTDTGGHELGFRFRSDVAGYVSSIRFYKGAQNTGTHVGHLWSASGTKLAEVTFTGESASGWQTARLPRPVRIEANQTYVASYFAPNGRWARTLSYFALDGYDNGQLHALLDGPGARNGVYNSGSSAFPTQSYRATNYWVDIVFETTANDVTAPRVATVTPANGATDVAVTAEPTAQFDEPMDASTVGGATVELRDGAGAAVAASVTYDAATRTAKIDPAAKLDFSTTYTATVRGGASGARDEAGNPLAGDHSWSFTTAPPASCPCTIWSDSAVPSVLSVPDTGPHELGVKFRSDAPGVIRGVRFYKGPSNTGTHVAHLWTRSGALLATATFENETATGWQQALFATPVPINADTTYVASYFAPNGGWARDRPFFDATGVYNAPLYALRDGLDGGNGVYNAGSPSFPAGSYGASNYWVDVVFAAS